jgi:hypothetical protein
MKNDILMFHCLMRAMPLNAEMSIGEICQAVEQSGGTFSGEQESSVRRALQIDKNLYFAHHANDRWMRVRDYKPIRLGGT